VRSPWSRTTCPICPVLRLSALSSAIRAFFSCPCTLARAACALMTPPLAASFNFRPAAFCSLDQRSASATSCFFAPSTHFR